MNRLRNRYFSPIFLRDLRKITIFASDELAENRVRFSQESDYINGYQIICELFEMCSVLKISVIFF